MEIIVFTSDWCSPCKKLKPILDNLESKMNLKVTRLDVEKEDEAVENYTIRNIPTVVILKDGKEVDRISGLVPSEVLEAKFKLHNKKANE